MSFKAKVIQSFTYSGSIGPGKDAFEDEVNNWLAANPNIEIVSADTHSVFTGEHVGQSPVKIFHTATLIIYKEP